MPNLSIMKAGQAATALIIILSGSSVLAQTRQNDHRSSLCLALDATALSLTLGVATLPIETIMADGSRRYESLLLPLQDSLKSYPPPTPIRAREVTNKLGGIVVIAEQEMWFGHNATGGFEQSKTVYLDTVQGIVGCYPKASTTSQSDNSTEESTTINTGSTAIIISRSSGVSRVGISSVTLTIATRKS